jgi:hypothetical protein
VDAAVAFREFPGDERAILGLTSCAGFLEQKHGFDVQAAHRLPSSAGR